MGDEVLERHLEKNMADGSKHRWLYDEDRAFYQKISGNKIIESKCTKEFVSTKKQATKLDEVVTPQIVLGHKHLINHIFVRIL